LALVLALLVNLPDSNNSPVRFSMDG
jgi:hypothetical protein